MNPLSYNCILNCRGDMALKFQYRYYAVDCRLEHVKTGHFFSWNVVKQSSTTLL